MTHDEEARLWKSCAAELVEFFCPANPPYSSKEAMAEDMSLVIARHFSPALAVKDAEIERLKRDHEARLLREYTTLRAQVERMRALLLRYRNEVPPGHQPHMIAHEVDAATEKEPQA